MEGCLRRQNNRLHPDKPHSVVPFVRFRSGLRVKRGVGPRSETVSVEADDQ
jgi:hypothetical protein